MVLRRRAALDAWLAQAEAVLRAERCQDNEPDEKSELEFEQGDAA